MCVITRQWQRLLQLCYELTGFFFQHTSIMQTKITIPPIPLQTERLFLHKVTSSWTNIPSDMFRQNFWHVTLCGLIYHNQSYRGTCCLHIQGRITIYHSALHHIYDNSLHGHQQNLKYHREITERIWQHCPMWLKYVFIWFLDECLYMFQSLKTTFSRHNNMSRKLLLHWSQYIKLSQSDWHWDNFTSFFILEW
jgi:hypothetical protein